MTQITNLARRRFLQSSALLMAASPWDFGRASEVSESVLEGRLFKTLKIGMVRVEGSLTDKFRVAKEAGFDGIELNAPGIDVAETRQAIEDSGLPVDGTVCASHWDVRHTSPDADTRAQALEHLKGAIRQTHAVGGNTVLLVVGRGTDGPEEEIWPRAIENIAKALPTAAWYGVHIAIENVWNQFLYDHEGGHDQTADKFVRFVDEFNSPWVGMQFDIGNHWKYGSMGDWIRQLGRRVVKLDIKGFSRQEDKFTDIGEGDLDWADVRSALAEIGYAGWVAAEVGGGGLDRLRSIASSIDKVLEIRH
jgi:L-ribulose-5-phosphate 3-epimerase